MSRLAGVRSSDGLSGDEHHRPQLQVRSPVLFSTKLTLGPRKVPRWSSNVSCASFPRDSASVSAFSPSFVAGELR